MGFMGEGRGVAGVVQELSGGKPRTQSVRRLNKGSLRLTQDNKDDAVDEAGIGLKKKGREGVANKIRWGGGGGKNRSNHRMDSEFQKKAGHKQRRGWLEGTRRVEDPRERKPKGKWRLLDERDMTVANS